MKNEVLYVLLPDFAAHEMVYLAEAISSDEYALKENPKYMNKIVAPDMAPIKAIGGFNVLPDYTFETMPDDYAALVLIGGFGWLTPIADKVAPIVAKAIADNKIIGAICNAASFMAKHGFVNNVAHTGNGIEPDTFTQARQSGVHANLGVEIQKPFLQFALNLDIESSVCT